jgi:type VI secretion system secreted protein Hcp
VAFDTFIKIDGIQGESGDEKHSGWMEILSIHWGVSNQSKPSQKSPTKTTAWDDFTFTKAQDSSSPKLFMACDNATPIKEILLEVCRAGGDKMKFLEYKFSACFINKISLSSGDSKETLPVETVSFKYQSVEMTYTLQKRQDGIGGGKVAAVFNLQRPAGE